jgi:hypothetical protein
LNLRQKLIRLNKDININHGNKRESVRRKMLATLFCAVSFAYFFISKCASAIRGKLDILVMTTGNAGF